MDIKVTFLVSDLDEQTMVFSQEDAKSVLHFLTGFINAGAMITKLEVL